MKIYTKTGDSGTTSLFGGRRVDKDSARIDAYGNVDELNSVIGAIVSLNPAKEITGKLLRIQEELMVLGSDLATPADVKVKIPKVSRAFITRLEEEIDAMNKNLPPLKKFILPGGHPVAANLHMARSVARRTERSVVALAQQEKISVNAQIYINRLSDWLFVLARYVNKISKVQETQWKGRG